MTATADYLAALEAWKARRLANLRAPAGWLNIIGRYVLDAGTTSVGTAADNDIVISAGPAHLGTVTQDGPGPVTFRPADGSETITVQPNKKSPPRFQVGDLLLEITTVNGDNALRIRDTASKAPGEFGGIEYFPAQQDWRIVAEWVPFEAPVDMEVDTTGNIRTGVAVTHKAVFTHEGKTYELIATHGTPESPQFVIKDPTSKDSTYPASRFLFGEDVTDTSIVLDFNKAINPPCAFTEFAVCPLPPPENVMPFRIEAGEKRLPYLL
jgi:uncharacterized protein (DUF1684 family)